jgi:hypothetical protein
MVGVVGGLAWLVLSSVWPQRDVSVNVRWKAGVDAVERVELERRFHLTRGELDEGTTWTYHLEDASPRNIQSLVQHQAVDDTAHLNRARFRPELAQDRSRQIMLATGAVVSVFGVASFVFLRRRPRQVRGEPWIARLGPPDVRRSHLWVGAVLLTSAPLLVAIGTSVGKAPYPISETVALLEDVENGHSYFDPTARSWYRPFFHLTFLVFWRGAGSLDAGLVLFRILEVTAAVGLVVLLIWHLRPQTRSDGAAAAFAVAVLVGTHAYRDNLELPLLMTLVAMPMILAVWMIAERDRRAWHGPAIIALAVLATGYKEQGLVIVPLVAAAWWAGSPGVSRATVAVLVLVTGSYLAFRFTYTGSWQTFEQGIGWGFQMLSTAEAQSRFASPWPVYAYNVVSTMANVLFSEPSSGVFGITYHASRGQLRAWEVNQLLSSAAATGLIAWWGIRAWRRDAGGPWSLESRVFIATVVTLLASGALGFNYARDRLGGMAVVFYAIAAYYAMRAALATVVQGGQVRMVAAVIGLVLLAGAWQVRALGTVEDARARAERSRREWIANLQQRRVRFADRPTYLRILNALTEQGQDPSLAHRTPYPTWVVDLLGER